ncbi:hypothetical protein RCZAHN_110 [Rhodobacter phage RcZahn]|nr:hypothetical protein RCZAHN_110 [Rhodobacter phage RcZahn]
MSKYSTDHNGITVGYDNVFFYRDAEGELRDFGAILVFEPMYPLKINSLNYNLESFATQLVWHRKMFHFPTIEPLMSSGKLFHVMRPWFEKWLNENTPGWGTPPISADHSREAPSVFFPQLKQARAFRHKIADLLAGMPDVRKGTLHGKKST